MRVLQFVIEWGRLQHWGMLGVFRHTEATCSAVVPHKATPASGFCSRKEGWVYFKFKAYCRVFVESQLHQNDP